MFSFEWSDTIIQYSYTPYRRSRIYYVATTKEPKLRVSRTKSNASHHALALRFDQGCFYPPPPRASIAAPASHLPRSTTSHFLFFFWLEIHIINTKKKKKKTPDGKPIKPIDPSYDYQNIPQRLFLSPGVAFSAVPPAVTRPFDVLAPVLSPFPSSAERAGMPGRSAPVCDKM